jgi:hypothetical protein
MFADGHELGAGIREGNGADVAGAEATMAQIR